MRTSTLPSRPARSMLRRATSAWRSSSSRLIRRPPSGSARPIQMVLYPPSVPISRMRRAWMARASRCRNCPWAGDTAMFGSAALSLIAASSTGSAGCSSPVVNASTAFQRSSFMVRESSVGSDPRSTPRHPDFLGRPAPRPVDGDEGIARDRLVRGAELDQVLDVESGASQETDPIAVVEVELHALFVGPFVPVHAEVVAPEVRPRRYLGVGIGHGEHEQRAVAEEDQPSPGSEQPGCLGDPAIRVTPDRRAVLADRAVEAGIGARRRFGAAPDQWEGEGSEE